MKLLAQFVLIGLAGVALGFGGNALRGKGALHVSKNYFDTGSSLVMAKRAAPVDPVRSGQDTAIPAGDGLAGHGKATSDANGTASGSSSGSSSANDSGSSDEGHLDHPYQTITFKEITALLDDPLTAAGLNVIVDARNEAHFADGHLPGAMLCNPYDVAKYIDNIIEGETMLDRVLAAEKVVVYCGGGDCADSVFMCRELLELDVPYDAIFLYEGGWKDWTAQHGPIEKGAE